MNSKKIIKKIIIILVYCVVLGELLIWIITGLTVPVAPNDELEKAISFIQETEYIGLTVNECSELLGEGKDWSDHVYKGTVLIYVGTKYYMNGRKLLQLCRRFF